MQVLLINGSPHKEGCTYTALAEVAGALSADGIGYEILHIGHGPIRRLCRLRALQNRPSLRLRRPGQPGDRPARTV